MGTLDKSETEGWTDRRAQTNIPLNFFEVGSIKMINKRNIATSPCDQYIFSFWISLSIVKSG